jgi:hypothetical protein
MSTCASFITSFWNDQLVDHGRQYLFLVLVGFVGSFAFIRISTRLMRSPRVPWWPGSVVSEGGVHVHHLVFGIVTMMASGVVSFALLETAFWYEVCAFLFGIGLGLTIDEFALWLYLDDVYWSREGRASIDATLLAVAAMGLILLGAAPFEIHADTAWDLIGTVAVTLLILSMAVICFAKQRLYHGAIGLFFWPLVIYGALRVGKPNSPWARRFYGERRPRLQAKSKRRFPPDRPSERIKERFRDLIGGVTHEEYQARLASSTRNHKAGS